MYVQIRIQMLTELPVQVDGEPWLQPPGQVVVLRSALKVNRLTSAFPEPNLLFANSFCKFFIPLVNFPYIWGGV